MSFSFNNYTQADLEIIKQQINSKEVFTCGILKKCRHGIPQIILLSPVKKIQSEEFFNYDAVSNIMWLTCPWLNNQIHEVENSSSIKKIRGIIQGNVLFQGMMLRAHAHYYFLRNYIFRKCLQASWFLPRNETGIPETGIGGMRDLTAIKCLHLHYCHYSTCKDNIAGLITLQLLQNKTECCDAYCTRYK